MIPKLKYLFNITLKLKNKNKNKDFKFQFCKYVLAGPSRRTSNITHLALTVAKITVEKIEAD